MIMSTIKQTYTINAPVQKVWETLTTTESAERWGAGPARVEGREGGEFSYWNGDIHGIFTKLVPNELIAQDWYGHDNPTWKYKAVFTFEEEGGQTIVHLDFSGDIQDEAKDIADWRDYYFEPIKKLLEQ